jgi:hypothetical protein
MTTLQILLICLTVIALAVILPRPYRRHAAPLVDERLLDREVVFYLPDGQSVRGVVRSVAGTSAILAGASFVSDGNTTPMAGAVDVPQESILLIQELPSDGQVVGGGSGTVRRVTPPTVSS